MKPIEKIQSIRKSIDNQEERMKQFSLHELRHSYEQISKRESELNDLLSQEKARNRMQQLEIDRRQTQLEESTQVIRTLQEELDIAWRKARGMSWELRENELKSKIETETVNLKAQLTGLEARIKRKQIEFDAIMESLRRENGEYRAIIKSKDEEINKLKSNVASTTDEEKISYSRDYLDRINQEIGSLKTENNAFKCKIENLTDHNKELQMKLTQMEEEKKILQFQIDTLKAQLSEKEGSSNQVYSHLTDEVEKVKQQKASLRCEFIQLKRKYEGIETENRVLREEKLVHQKANDKLEELGIKLSTAESQRDTIKSENNRLKERLETIDDDYKKRLNDMERMIRENEASERAQVKLLNSELEVQHRKYEGTSKTLVELDSQCEKLLSNLRNKDAELKNTQSENNFLKNEIDSLKQQFADKFKLQSEYSALTEKNKFLEGKITYLERELKEANTDHRQELEKLSDQLTETSSSIDVKQHEMSEKKTESQSRQLESQIRSLERELEQSKKENGILTTEMNELRKREMEVINENTLLRQNFAECLKKAEDFRDQIKEITETNADLKQEMEKDTEKLTSLEDQLFDLRNDMEQKEKLIAYLQSVVQPKQMQKLPRPRSSLLSTESDCISDIESEYKYCQQLEQRRNELRVDLERKRMVLSEKENKTGDSSIPLLKNRDQFKTPTSPSTLKHSSTESTISKVPGKMRHDIPHRWKRQFVTVNSNRCKVCMEGLPHFRHIYRCRDCQMAVHQHCRQTVVNTCGLPSECADFYLDTYSISNEDMTMTGWVKLVEIAGQRPMDKWRNAWACIKEHKLSFYDNDQLAINDGIPFIRIDLDVEQWRIYNQTAEKPLDGVRGEDMSVLIELRMPSYTLLMLTPTVQAKQRWIQALQYATNRRIFHRRSSTIVNNALLLALEEPQNLSINCTQMLRNEWLMIGAEQGLFATSIQQQQLRAPFQIAGIPKIFWMELLPEFDMLLAICGTNRSLMCAHLQQLERAFKADQQPSVHMISVSNIEQCHIAILSKPEHNREKRFAYIATIDSIIIIQYIAKLGVFTPVKQFKTEEPCMCICSTPIGFIFGADNFRFVKFDNDFSSDSQLMVDNCPFDYPVSAVEITDNEYLLAFHNFGLFVDSQGKRTRTRNIEWEKVPLEFVYIAPYLYIVYCEFIEVVRIAPLIGPDSGTLTDDRNVFKCRSAHRTGLGLNPQEVLFVVSSKNRVELHSFSRHEQEDQQQQAVKSILKRKFNETGTLSGTKKKH